MRALSHSRGTIVNRVRVIGSPVERGSALAAMESLLDLAGVDSRLPPSAVLFIRKLRDPRPGLARLEGYHAGTQVEWARALQDEIDRQARNAARPALGHVGANAEAVWFADRAELLAMLASDWCSGNAITRWWWQSLFRATDVTSAVIGEWLTSIEYVPAAFAKLAQRGDATRFAGALPASAVRRMVDEITRHFGLTELRDSLSASRNENGPRVRDVSRHAQASRSGPSKLLKPSEVSELRIRWAPEAFSPRLDKTARVLLAAVLMLERAPAVLRERSFASRLLASLFALETGGVVEKRIAVEQSQLDGDPATDSQADNQSQGQRLMPLPKRTSETQPNNFQAALPSQERLSEYRVQHSSSAPLEEQQNSEPARVVEGHSSEQPAKGSAVTAEPGATEALLETPIPEAEVAAATIEARIETKLGGIFYLINAALALNFYGDFTTPLEPGIGLPIWDFLALMGRRLSGKRIESDPIWTLLGALAGRNHREKPGCRFKPADEWRMPPHWLTAFPEREMWSYQASQGRLIVCHAAGFTVLDVKMGSKFRMKDIEAKLAKETRCYLNVSGLRQSRIIRGKLRRRERELERWTRWVADYLRARLVRALGIESAEPVGASLRGRPSSREISASHNQGAPTEGRPYRSNGRSVHHGHLAVALFDRTARVEVTPGRLDIFFSLDELPVEIRVSGLDRDPGWLPAAGRVVAFHYD